MIPVADIAPSPLATSTTHAVTQLTTDTAAVEALLTARTGRREPVNKTAASRLYALQAALQTCQTAITNLMEL